MNEQNKKVPTVRFKGFTNDWEQRKLRDISTRVLRKNKDLQSTLPLTISAQDGLVDQTTFFHKQVASKQLSNYILLFKGEFAYNKSYSEGYPFGAIKRLNKYSKGVLSTLYIVFKPKNVNSDFLEHYYDTSKWYREIYRNAAEGARNHGLLNISAKDFFGTMLYMPQKNEQALIANVLDHLDSLITLQQRKLDLLKQLKKGFLQKMFADKDSKQPVLRFKGFHDDWEQRKLGDIALFSKGKGISKKDLHTHGIYNIVHYADIYKFMPVQDKVLHHSNNKMGVRIGSNSLLFAGSDVTPKGLARTTAIKQENVRVGGDVIIADLSEKHINYFMSYEINMNKRFIYPFITGSTVRHIHGSDLSHLNITFPSLSEQKSIAHIFNLIEHELSLLKIKKSKYQSIKKSLLQQMFI